MLIEVNIKILYFNKFLNGNRMNREHNLIFIGDEWLDYKS